MPAAQTVLAPPDISTGLAAVIFAQTIGGAIFVSVGQTVFSNALISSLHAYVEDLDPEIVIGNGAMGLRHIVWGIDERFVTDVLIACDEAIKKVFVVGVVMTCAMMVGSLGMEWKSVQGKKVEVEWIAGCIGVSDDIFVPVLDGIYSAVEIYPRRLRSLITVI